MSDIDNPFEYRSTPALPDDEGKALLDELSDLYFETVFVRKNSAKEKLVFKAMMHALRRAWARFDNYNQLYDWLCRNTRPDIAAYMNSPSLFDEANNDEEKD
jgi:hypothetical protein